MIRIDSPFMKNLSRLICSIALISQLLCLNAHAQNWVTEIKTKYVKIENYSGWCLDQNGGYDDTELRDCNRDIHQQWEMIMVRSPDVYALKNRATGKFLDHYGGIARGGEVKAVHADYYNDHRYWHIYDLWNTGDYVIRNMASGHFLERWHNDTAPQAKSGAEYYSHNRRWKLVPIIEPVNYTFQNLGTNQFLDQNEDNKIRARGGNLAAPHPNQQWSLIFVGTDNGTEYYALKNLVTGLVLDHYYGNKGDISIGNPENIQAGSNDPGNMYHQWAIILYSDGTFGLKNKATGMVLDHYFGQSDMNSIRADNDDLNHPNHRWYIRPVNFPGVPEVELTDDDKDSIASYTSYLQQPAPVGGSWGISGVGAYNPNQLTWRMNLAIWLPHIFTNHLPMHFTNTPGLPNSVAIGHPIGANGVPQVFSRGGGWVDRTAFNLAHWPGGQPALQNWLFDRGIEIITAGAAGWLPGGIIPMHNRTPYHAFLVIYHFGAQVNYIKIIIDMAHNTMVTAYPY